MEHAQTQKLFLVFSLVVTLGLSQPIEESKILAVGWSDWSDIFDDLLDIVTPKTTQCGLSNSPVVIVGVHGGSDAERNEWPWMAMLIDDAYDGEQFCDGTIIDEYHILTAAHCVDGLGERSDVDNLKVRLGAHNLENSANESGVQDIGVKLVVKHKGFSMETVQSDIAILVLKSPVKYTDTIKPICLPEGNSSYAGEKGTVVGWGLLGYGGSSPKVLQELTTEIWDNERCSSNYEKKYPDSPASITETMLCSGKEGKSPCHGDSGGPFMFRNDDGHWEQIGVVSWGGNLCGQNNLPAVYTRITHFMDWIKKVQRLYPN